MNAYEFHEACHEACMQCPQFSGFDNDQMFMGSSVPFGKIPKHGMFAVYTFWKDNHLLMGKGYFNALPEEAQGVFNRIEKVVEAAIKKEFS